MHSLFIKQKRGLPLLSILVLASCSNVGSSFSQSSLSSFPSSSNTENADSTSQSAETMSMSSDSQEEVKSSDSQEEIKLVFTNKDTYLLNEDIYIKAYGDANEWVGIYRYEDDVNSLDSIMWSYVNKNGFQPNTFYDVRKSLVHNQSRRFFTDLPNHKYKAVLYSDDQMEKSQYSNHIKAISYFEVLSESITKPNEPTNATYTLNDSESGFSNGIIKLEFDSVPVNKVCMYWGNENGILEDYTALREEIVYSNPCSITLDDDSIIPQNATKLYIFSSNSAGTSDEAYVLSLPSGSQDDGLNNFQSEFEVISDIHIAIKNEHLASSDAVALHKSHLNGFVSDLKNVNGDKKTSVVVVGDIANSGGKEEWELADSILSGSDFIDSTYYSIGNHDLYDGSYDNQIAYFYEYAKKDSVYYKIDIDGYTHIFLGSESTNNGLDAWLSDGQLNWFKTTMDEETSENPDKPVFVYLHQSLYNTVSGSLPGQGWNGVTQDAKFRDLVSKYRQILLFNGHSHWTMNSVKNHCRLNQNLPHVFNTASIAYLWDSVNVPTGEYLRGSQGYYLKTTQKSVYILGRDYEQNKFIASACYRVDLRGE